MLYYITLSSNQQHQAFFGKVFVVCLYLVERSPSLLLSFPSRRLLLFWYGSYQSMRLRIVVCFVSPFSYFILTCRHTFAACVHSSVSSSLDIPLFSGDFMNNSILPFFMASFSPLDDKKKRSMIFFQFCYILKTTFLSLMKNSGESAKKSWENNIRISFGD